MKIQFCGLGHASYVGDPEDATSVPLISFYHDGERKILKKKAWEALALAELANEESVVEIVASETTDKDGKEVPYAIVTYEEEVETSEQVEMVIKFLTEEVRIDVEEPRAIRFHRRKK
jgi:hypothetical protein